MHFKELKIQSISPVIIPVKNWSGSIMKNFRRSFKQTKGLSVNIARENLPKDVIIHRIHRPQVLSFKKRVKFCVGD